MKLYNEKARVYHDLYKDIFDYAHEFNLFNDLFLKNYNVKKILELGCGSGSLTKYFLKHYDCIGLDLSSDMIKIAQEINPDGTFIQGDMRNLPSKLNNQFDAAVCTGRSFTHLTTNRDCIDCCESVNRVLKPGGWFVFDNFYAEAIFTNFKSETTHESKYITRKSKSKTLLEQGFTWQWHAEYLIRNDSGKVIDTFEDDTVLRAFTKDELILFLMLAGYEAIQVQIDRENPISLLSCGRKPM